MSEYFIARQPILDQKLDLYGYELLFRDSMQNAAPVDLDEDAATAQVLTTSNDVGLHDLVGDQLAFINLPQKFLTEPDLLLLPPEKVVLEILETVELNGTTLAGIEQLRQRGFQVALDDVVEHKQYSQAQDHVDIVKLEIPGIEPGDWGQIISELKALGFRVLAEKVETNEEFEQLVELGCDYFQGYFFARPRVVTGRRLTSNKLAMLQLMSRINDPDTDIETLSELVSRDVALSVRVMNYVNSAATALNRHVESIREAVVYLGRDTIRHLVMLLTMGSVDDRPNALINMALQRGKLCELIGKHNEAEDGGAFFTVGLFSVLDALMDAPMEDVIEKLTVTDDVREALVSQEGAMGEALLLAVALERGDTSSLDQSSVPGTILADMYLQATRWADGVFEESGLSG